MGGSGTAISMNKLVKYNRSQLRGPKNYSTLKSYIQIEYDRRINESKKAYQGKEVPAEELARIKFKIKQDIRAQKKRANILSYSITALLLAILYWIIFW